MIHILGMLRIKYLFPSMNRHVLNYARSIWLMTVQQ